jgi:hypothetical protein
MQMLQHAETTAFPQLQIHDCGVEDRAVQCRNRCGFGIHLAGHVDVRVVFEQCDQMPADERRVFDQQYPEGSLAGCFLGRA